MGIAMGLPWLEAMSGSLPAALAQSASSSGAPLSSAAPPLRMAFIFMPNGVNYPAWNPLDPAAAAPSFLTSSAIPESLSPTLAPLAPVRQHLNIFTGLTLNKARANGDGPGDHARSSASFLTGEQARKTAGNDIHIGLSVDQAAAQRIGARTRLPSLEIGCEYAPTAGNCDSGYSCAYTSNISWRAEDAPMPKIINPAEVFERLFADVRNAEAQAQRLSRRQSILDFISADARQLSQRLGASDRRKLDQYQTSIREIELRIDRARTDAAQTQARSADLPSPSTPPTGIPATTREHIDLMYDLLLLAFQMDATRIATFMLAVDGSNRTFPEIGIRDGHHNLSHHQNNQEMVDKIRLIDRYYMERFARFIENLAATPDGLDSAGNPATLLDHCMILHGGGISDGNAHNHENLPILMAGKGGGSAEGRGGVETGRIIQAPRETPLCNLYLSMLERMDCPLDRFGDSTSPLPLPLSI